MAQPIKLANDILEREILGKGFASPLRINPATKDFAVVDGPDNVRQCIEDLLGTRVGERVMNEDFGVELPDLVFELQAGLLDIIPSRIREAIARWEPRVKNVLVTARAQATAIYVDVSWTLVTTAKKGNLVYPYYLEPSN
jgi:phage baseplate assembly protein W